MGAKHNSCFDIRIKRGDDILPGENLSVEDARFILLHDNIRRIAQKSILQPGSAGGMGAASGNPSAPKSVWIFTYLRAESALKAGMKMD